MSLTTSSTHASFDAGRAPTVVQARAVAQPTLATTIVRRVAPVVAASAGVALATLAAERTLAGLAIQAAERVGLTPRSRRTSLSEVSRVIVTRTVIVERMVGPR